MVMVVMVVMPVMAVPVMMMLMSPGLSLLLFSRNRLNTLHPTGRSRYLIEIKHSGIQYLIQVNISIVALDDAGRRLYSRYDSADTRPLFRSHLRCLVEQNDVAELYLLEDKVFDIILVQIFLHKTVSAGKFVLKPEGVHYSNHTVQTWHGTVILQSGIHSGHSAYRTGNRLRLADPAGFYDDVVEAVHPYQLGNLVHQVCLQSTADTAVLKSNQTVVLSAYDPTFLNKSGIYVDFSDIVYDDGKPYTFPVGKDPVHQRCFPAAQISGKEQHRNFLSIHILLI